MFAASHRVPPIVLPQTILSVLGRDSYICGRHSQHPPSDQNVKSLLQWRAPKKGPHPAPKTQTYQVV